MDRRDFLKGIGAGLVGVAAVLGVKTAAARPTPGSGLTVARLQEIKRGMEEMDALAPRYEWHGEVYGRGPMHNAFRAGNPDDTVIIFEDDSECQTEYGEAAGKAMGRGMDEHLLKAFNNGFGPRR